MEKSYTQEEINEIVSVLYDLMPECRVFAFTGTLGAGKTTLVRALLERCGVTGVIASPTFTYVNSYKAPDGKELHHFDLYRLGSYDEFVEAGFDEYLSQQNGWVFIEWPEIVIPHIHKKICHVNLSYVSPGRRIAQIEIK